MKLTPLTIPGLALLTCWLALPSLGAAETPAQPARQPAVAGLFYPKNAEALSRAVATHLSRANPKTEGNLRALITPHAGYDYSGPVAAQAFQQLVGRTYTTVVVMGPSHYAMLDAASISGARLFRTPLGDVPISDKAAALGKLKPFQIEAPAEVARPEWWTHSSRSAPAEGSDRADTWEHSVEVEIPFLQETLKTFFLLPIVMGNVDTARAARALEQVLDEDTLLIASSDLSHYHPYAEAQALDRHAVDAILTLNTKTMAREEACGRIPILTLLEVAKHRRWKPQLLDLRNSGDTSGDKSRVVGYTAIAFYAPTASAPAALTSAPVTSYREADRRLLLKLARDSVRAAATRSAAPSLTGLDLSAELTEKKGCFVTLNKKGALRGCIGTILPQAPLYQSVIENAHSAAMDDSRFSPVAAGEVEQLEIEVSVLTEPRPLTFASPEDLLRQLRPNQDGVLLKIGDRVATYLPQVWSQLPDKAQFMTSLAEKAGARPFDWRKPGVVVAVYQVESFSDAQFAPTFR